VEPQVIVMPANACGWHWHTLARETGRLGHLFSPGGQRGPWPWLPYALDNGAFSCWDQDANTFDEAKWAVTERAWHRLIVWSQIAAIRPMWAIVPDVPGNAEATLARWAEYAPELTHVPRALAVQDGMTADMVRALRPAPDVICVGGSTEWKWATVEMWARAFPRVHLLRCNSPPKLYELEAMGVESCDGTGWSRGDRKQTQGIEEWARSKAVPSTSPLWPYVCRRNRTPQQESFA
jgi:hypothetical protein